MSNVRHAEQSELARERARMLDTLELLLQRLDPHQPCLPPSRKAVRHLEANLHLLKRMDRLVAESVIVFCKRGVVEHIVSLLLHGFEATLDQLRFLRDNILILAEEDLRAAAVVHLNRRGLSVAFCHP